MLAPAAASPPLSLTTTAALIAILLTPQIMGLVHKRRVHIALHCFPLCSLCSHQLKLHRCSQLSCTNQVTLFKSQKKGWNCASDVKLTQQTTCLKQGLLVNRSSNINRSMTIALVKWVHKVKCSDDSEEGILQGWQTSYTWSHLRSDLSHILTSTAPIY